MVNTYSLYKVGHEGGSCAILAHPLKEKCHGDQTNEKTTLLYSPEHDALADEQHKLCQNVTYIYLREII